MIQNENELISSALAGDRPALEQLLSSIQDLTFNLSLRMLGSIHDAEDASQEIIIKIMTNLAAFKQESAFSTWVYRIATNYLINTKKSMFANHPLSFEECGEDTARGSMDNDDPRLRAVDTELLAEELKLSCTNVMLQCFDAESRCIFILGTMFGLDSRVAGEVLNMTPENYRQKLSRARKKMADYLGDYCGLTKTGGCSCKKRVGYAAATHRLNPGNLEYSRLAPLDENLLMACKEQMEIMDDVSLVFTSMPKYKSPVAAGVFVNELLKSQQMHVVQTIV